MLRYVLASLLIVCSNSLLGAEVVTYSGKVTEIAAFPHGYGNYDESQKGRLTIYVEGMPPGCGDGLRRVVLGVDHPIHDSVLSIALFAKATGTPVRVAYFNECTIRAGSWDLAYLSLK